MNVIVDTNILISACLNEESDIFKILTTLSQTIDFVIPDYALAEIEKHKRSICESTGRNIIIFDKLLNQCFDKGIIISVADISTEYFILAEQLTKNIDINDAAFVAFSIALDALIWTGDLKLSRGLKRIGFNNIISTKELKDIIKRLMIKTPSYLKKGDTIGITCPAGYMAKEKAQTCIETLQQWGFEVMVGKTLGSNSVNYFSGTDEERLNEFQAMLDDDSINAILCGRGGYGVSRIIDQLDFTRFKKNPKWIIGFSDITVLHAHIHTKYKIATLHAPMAAAFNEDGFKSEYIASLHKAILGKKANYKCAAHPFNKQGIATGELIGGNLSLLAHLIGTPSDLKTTNKILFIEDIGEYIYGTDRMLYQLKRSGKLDKLAGLIIGGFTDVKDTERPFGKTIEEVINDIVKEYDYPICFNFPVSHEKENYALKVGGTYELKTGRKTVHLTEK